MPEEPGKSVRKRRREESSDEPEETDAKAEVMRLKVVNQKLREIIKTLTAMQAL